MLAASRYFVLRRIAPVLATLLLVAACGSSATTAVPPGSAGDSAPAGPAGTAPPPSAVGSPTGDSVTKTIGPAGGSLSSADGGITVAIRSEPRPPQVPPARRRHHRPWVVRRATA